MGERPGTAPRSLPHALRNDTVVGDVTAAPLSTVKNLTATGVFSFLE